MNPFLWIVGSALLIGALASAYAAAKEYDEDAANTAIRWATLLAMAGALCWRFA